MTDLEVAKAVVVELRRTYGPSILGALMHAIRMDLASRLRKAAA